MMAQTFMMSPSKMQSLSTRNDSLMILSPNFVWIAILSTLLLQALNELQSPVFRCRPASLLPKRPAPFSILRHGANFDYFVGKVATAVNMR
jgi:hypothetical protein